MGTPTPASDLDVIKGLNVDDTTLNTERFDRNVILNPKSTEPSLVTPLCSVLGADDTVHYLSPASLSPPLTAVSYGEGGFGGIEYKTPTFMRVLQDLGGIVEGSYVSSSISCVEPEMQRTLAIVKPEAMVYEDLILKAVEDAGFTVLQKRYLHLTPEYVSELFSQHYGTAAFPHLVVSMSAGPLLSLCLGAVNAVNKWKDLVGPQGLIRAEWFHVASMRVRFGLVGDVPDVLHASDNLREATNENRYVNPESVIEPILAERDRVTDYCGKFINPTLSRGLTDVVRAKPVDPILYLADWLLNNNPLQPRFPPDVAVLPT